MADVLDRSSTVWAAGVFLPLAMVIGDPVVFRSSAFVGMTPILGAFKAFGYVGIICGVGIVVAHLLFVRRSAVCAGALAGGSLFALALGVVLLPFSFFGAFVFGIGLLGLTPFASGLVVGRCARNAYRAAARPRRLPRAAAGFVLFWCACGVGQWRASAALDQGIQEICSERPDTAAAGAARIGRWRVLLDLDELAATWIRERDETKRACLATAYLRLTGGSIEQRAAALED